MVSNVDVDCSHKCYVPSFDVTQDCNHGTESDFVCSKEMKDKSRAKVLEDILIRECLLESLQDASKKLRRNSTNMQEDTPEPSLLELFVNLKKVTVRIVEGIIEWRKGGDEKFPAPFWWRGENYLLKIVNDLNFLSGVRPLVLALNMHPSKLCRNPLMMNLTIDEQRKIDRKEKNKNPKYLPKSYSNSRPLLPKESGTVPHNDDISHSKLLSVVKHLICEEDIEDLKNENSVYTSTSRCELRKLQNLNMSSSDTNSHENWYKFARTQLVKVCCNSNERSEYESGLLNDNISSISIPRSKQGLPNMESCVPKSLLPNEDRPGSIIPYASPKLKKSGSTYKIQDPLTQISVENLLELCKNRYEFSSRTDIISFVCAVVTIALVPDEKMPTEKELQWPGGFYQMCLRSNPSNITSQMKTVQKKLKLHPSKASCLTPFVQVSEMHPLVLYQKVGLTTALLAVWILQSLKNNDGYSVWSTNVLNDWYAFGNTKKIVLQKLPDIGDKLISSEFNIEGSNASIFDSEKNLVNEQNEPYVCLYKGLRRLQDGNRYVVTVIRNSNGGLTVLAFHPKLKNQMSLFIESKYISCFRGSLPLGGWIKNSLIGLLTVNSDNELVFNDKVNALDNDLMVEALRYNSGKTSCPIASPYAIPQVRYRGQYRAFKLPKSRAKLGSTKRDLCVFFEGNSNKTIHHPVSAPSKTQLVHYRTLMKCKENKMNLCTNKDADFRLSMCSNRADTFSDDDEHSDAIQQTDSDSYFIANVRSICDQTTSSPEESNEIIKKNRTEANKSNMLPNEKNSFTNSDDEPSKTSNGRQEYKIKSKSKELDAMKLKIDNISKENNSKKRSNKFSENSLKSIEQAAKQPKTMLQKNLPAVQCNSRNEKSVNRYDQANKPKDEDLTENKKISNKKSQKCNNVILTKHITQLERPEIEIKQVEIQSTENHEKSPEMAPEIDLHCKNNEMNRDSSSFVENTEIKENIYSSNIIADNLICSNLNVATMDCATPNLKPDSSSFEISNPIITENQSNLVCPSLVIESPNLAHENYNDDFEKSARITETSDADGISKSVEERCNQDIACNLDSKDHLDTNPKITKSSNACGKNGVENTTKNKNKISNDEDNGDIDHYSDDDDFSGVNIDDLININVDDLLEFQVGKSLNVDANLELQALSQSISSDCDGDSSFKGSISDANQKNYYLNNSIDESITEMVADEESITEMVADEESITEMVADDKKNSLTENDTKASSKSTENLLIYEVEDDKNAIEIEST